MSQTLPVCRDFLKGACQRAQCRFMHVGSHEGVRHASSNQNPRQHPHAPHSRPSQRPKNTETFDPLDRPVDMRVVIDLGRERLDTPLTTRDVLCVPNLFGDFAPGELYQKLTHEITHNRVPPEELLKPWHGDTHLIADDQTHWKRDVPTFSMVVDRIRDFFQMDVKATRFNWYQDTSQWKPFHFDSAKVDPKKAAVQNFTVAVSFGATRDAAFEDARTKTVISMPQADGSIYAFARETNLLWRHGILKEPTTRPEGRVSIICWGWLDGQRE